jgi:cytidine deaminase
VNPKELHLDSSPVLQSPVLQSLVRAALEVRLRAHAPYSNFQVGAALLAEDGEVFEGCNVENASFSLTLCAERVAAVAAVTAQKRNWQAIAIASTGGVTPCGACRQFLSEFGRDLLVICVNAQSRSIQMYQLSELLPHAFDHIPTE